MPDCRFRFLNLLCFTHVSERYVMLCYYEEFSVEEGYLTVLL